MLLGYDLHGGQTARMRVRGFLEGLAEAGLTAYEELLVGAGWTRGGGQSAIEEHLDAGRPMPDAIFSAT
ncbi:hypothetical protein AB0H88_22825 [Nonomuraea sp. NPDC050680]|uniref:hypothetical protein n=1 Tax=Nonomuraea sp. NPDC050680 TaxID=3154630 RepID=UPI0033F44D67